MALEQVGGRDAGSRMACLSHPWNAGITQFQWSTASTLSYNRAANMHLQIDTETVRLGTERPRVQPGKTKFSNNGVQELFKTTGCLPPSWWVGFPTQKPL